MKMLLNEVPVGSIVKFSDEGASYEITSSNPHNNLFSFKRVGYDEEFSDLYYHETTEIFLLMYAETMSTEFAESAKQELLDLIGEPCTNGVNSDTKGPCVTFLLDTGVIT